MGTGVRSQPLRGTPWTPVPVQYLPPSSCWVLYTIRNLAPRLLLPRGRCYYKCALLYMRDAYGILHGRHVCYYTRVIPVHYRTDDTCATLHVRHATTDRNTRALPTRGHARPRVRLAERRITNLCAHRSLCCSTRARSLHVGTPAHVCTVYGRPVRNLRARAGRHTTDSLPKHSLRPRSDLPLDRAPPFRTFPSISRNGGTETPPRGRSRLLAGAQAGGI